MRCPRCEADTPDGAKFCIECGTPLRARCPQCGADVLPRAKFCAECGTPLTAHSPALPAAPSPSPLSYTPGYLAERILCHLGLGKLYTKIERRAEARAKLDTAIELYRAMAMTFWLPQAEAALTRVEGG
jgi:predicted amidophosphoribosyltransferase